MMVLPESFVGCLERAGLDLGMIENVY